MVEDDVIFPRRIYGISNENNYSNRSVFASKVIADREVARFFWTDALHGTMVLMTPRTTSYGESRSWLRISTASGVGRGKGTCRPVLMDCDRRQPDDGGGRAGGRAGVPTTVVACSRRFPKLSYLLFSGIRERKCNLLKSGAPDATRRERGIGNRPPRGCCCCCCCGNGDRSSMKSAKLFIRNDHNEKFPQ